MTTVNHQYRLKARPTTGLVSREHLDWQSQPLPALRDGQALIRVVYASLDPTMRIWMTDVPQYMPPVRLGDIMRAGGLGRVIASKNSSFKEGDLVSGLLGLQEYAIAGDPQTDPQAVQVTVLPNMPGIPLPAYCGILGATGATAYFGLHEVAQLQKSDTVVISAAAGAVGSVAGQLARLHGCRVVGIAGGPQKCAWLTEELGFDAAIDYKKAGWEGALQAACPNGVDVDFENVGGAMMNSVLGLMSLRGRVALCGAISSYNGANVAGMDTNTVLMKRLQVRGFIILDFAARMGEAVKAMAPWVREGRLKHRETIVDGLETAPDSLNMLFRGENVGKLLLRVSPE